MTPLIASSVRSQRAAIVAVSALMVAEAAATLVLPWLGGKLAGQAAEPQQGVGAGIIVLVLGALALQAALRFAVTRVSGGIGETIIRDLSMRVFDHLQCLPLAVVYERKRGELLARHRDQR